MTRRRIMSAFIFIVNTRVALTIIVYTKSRSSLESVHREFVCPRRQRLIINFLMLFQDTQGKEEREKNESAGRLFANERAPNRPLERQFAEDELIKGPELGELGFR
jgi:hypothetical protein